MKSQLMFILQQQIDAFIRMDLHIDSDSFAGLTRMMGGAGGPQNSYNFSIEIRYVLLRVNEIIWFC